MKTSGRALGNATRQANKKLRREGIFNIAKRLIATKGLDDFTISELAHEAGVTTPTIHNLFGKKSDIIRELVAQLIEEMQGILLNPPIDPIENRGFNYYSGIGFAIFSSNIKRELGFGGEYILEVNDNKYKGMGLSILFDGLLRTTNINNNKDLATSKIRLVKFVL